MQNIQDAVGHFGQAARLLDEGMARITERWAQIERAQLSLRAADERWRQMEARLGTAMEERWMEFQARLETMVRERVETLVQQRLQVMVAEAVEVKVGRRLEHMERKLQDEERERNRETGEATSGGSGVDDTTMCNRDGDEVNKRLTALEGSVEKALEIMFPRVEKLLTQLEIEKQTVLESPTQYGSSPSMCFSTVSNFSTCQLAQLSFQLSPATAPGAARRISSSSSASSPRSSHSLFQSPSATASAPGAASCPPTLHLGHSVDNLIQAAKEGNSDEVQVQLAADIDINSCDSYGNTALYWSAFKGHCQTVTLLLESGANANLRNAEGWSPLHAAARWGLTACISILLDAGADIESKTETGRTPLHVAANSGREQSVELLLLEGARINARDNEGLTPSDLANSAAVRRLLRR